MILLKTFINQTVYNSFTNVMILRPIEAKRNSNNKSLDYIKMC